MFVIGETIFHSASPELVITIYIPLRDMESMTDGELVEETTRQLSKYLDSERKRADRMKKLPKHLGGQQ